MSDERLEILKMVRDGVISVEDAERLLHALDEGEQKKREESQRKGRRPRVQAHAAAMCGGGGKRGGIGAFIGGLGSTVQSVVQEALEGVEIDLSLDAGDEEELEELELVDSGFEVPPDTRLRFRCRRSRGGGSVELYPVEGGRCLLELAEGKSVRARERSGEIRLSWDGGPLRVGVPGTVSRVSVATLGGDVRGADLPCPLEAKTHGGLLELTGLAHPFQAKTLGGNVRLGLAAGLTGDSKAVTLGGDVQVEVSDGVSAEVTATTLGGDLEVDPALESSLQENKHRRKRKYVLLLGDGRDASVYLKTLGGSIRLTPPAPAGT